MHSRKSRQAIIAQRNAANKSIIKAEEEARIKKEEEEARIKKEEEARIKKEEEEVRIKKEEEVRIKKEEEARIKKLEEAKKLFEEQLTLKEEIKELFDSNVILTDHEIVNIVMKANKLDVNSTKRYHFVVIEDKRSEHGRLFMGLDYDLTTHLITYDGVSFISNGPFGLMAEKEATSVASGEE